MPPLRVLIVDDSRAFRVAARRLLERECLEVLEDAATSADAMRLAERLRPDVMLVDVMLADESGLELTRRLVAQRRSRGPSVILISSHAEEDLADLLAESPAAGFLAKPDLCAAEIERVLGSQRL
jgi:two-component system, NarL family, nitrate/nitrite response regulator NarL